MANKKGNTTNLKKKKLTQPSDKQRIFITEYLKDCNATAAAERCGINPNWAMQLLKKPYIKHAIDVAIRKMEKKVQMNVENLLAVAWALVISDVTNYVKWNKEGKHKLIPSRNLGWTERQSLRSIKFSKGKTGDSEVTFTTHDKQHALNLLFKYYKLTGEKQSFQEWLQAVDEPLRLRITTWLEQQAASELKNLQEATCPTSNDL